MEQELKKNLETNVEAGPVSAQKGITLIALVITIVLMIILAAVTIKLAVDGGIFDYAKNAVGETQKVINAEQQLINDIIEEYIKPNVSEGEAGTDDETGNDSEIPVTIIKGTFVEYGVEYTDAYISKEYTTTNGWRLLDYTDNGDGTITDVELISTGIPAKLYYYYNDTTNSSWYVTDETKLASFKEILGGSNYTFYTGTDTYYALQASAGMYYNFGDIKFAYGTSDRGRSLGYFTSITVNGTTYNVDNTTEVTGNNLFKVGNNVEGVRLLTLKEVNEGVGRTDVYSMSTIPTTEDNAGLYRLDQLSAVEGMSDYSYASSGDYWLASPDPVTDSNYDVCSVSCDGNVGIRGRNYGVRPVVTLKSDVNFTVESNTNETTGITYLTLTPAA